MLYILEDIHSSRGSGCCYLVVEADNEKEAEQMADEFVANDERTLNIPLFKTKMRAHKSMCPIVINKDNFQKVCQDNPFKKIDKK